MRRSTKRRLRRGGLYALLVAIIALAAVSADWARLGEYLFDTDTIHEMWPDMVTIAARNTILFTLTAFVGGLLLGIVLALMKLSSIGPYRWLATGYIEIFRGLPALLTIFAIAYLLPIGLGVQVPFAPIGAGLLGLVLVAGAYMAETIRAGIQGVPKGQTEAARSLGMSPARTMISITLPQAFRIIIPPLTNEFVLLIKDTSLLFIAGSTPPLRELTLFARDNVSRFANGTPLLMAALMYLLITIPLTRLVAVLERRLGRSR